MLETIFGTVFGLIVTIGIVVGLIALFIRFRHSIMKVIGVITTIFLILVAIALLFEYGKVVFYLAFSVILLAFVVWLIRR